jgi:hypothetical protein
MAWYVHASFSDEKHEIRAFELQDAGSANGSVPDWPTQIRSLSRVEPIPDLVAVPIETVAELPLPALLTINSQYVANQIFKDMVEELEPGLHQFIPVKIRTSRSSSAGEVTYWIVNVLKRIDAVHDGTTVTRLRELGRIPSRERAREMFGPSYNFVDKAAVADSHLWRSDHAFTKDLYFSEELMRRIQAAKLDGMTPRRAIEIDQS